MRRRLPLLLVAATTMAACAVHEPVGVFRSRIFLGERGISVPLPPPSLIEQPKQEVDIDGQIEGEGPPDGVVLRIADTRGDADETVPLSADTRAFTASLTIDVTDNCLEFWLEAPDGARGEPQLFSARVANDVQTLEVAAHCDDD
jgi:hypothetical protein